MIGKKNVVFGFLYLVFTAALGPYMVVNLMPGVDEARGEKQAAVGRLQQLKLNGYEEELEPLSADQLARANTEGLLALNNLMNARQPVDAIKGGAHAHGNLEALLNIAAGVALCFVAVAKWFKQAISWIFILGAVFHSGALYLLSFGMGWAGMMLQVGPWLVLIGLLLMGVAALIGFSPQVVRDSS
ncbi:MAG: hypothetical protein JSW10_00705 [Pseudomonadota bacterium]|nr:MAG: hypothetical protein JSW10_00705 [Pseudomonadota bacterium]